MSDTRTHIYPVFKKLTWAALDPDEKILVFNNPASANAVQTVSPKDGSTVVTLDQIFTRFSVLNDSLNDIYISVNEHIAASPSAVDGVFVVLGGEKEAFRIGFSVLRISLALAGTVWLELY